MITGEEEDLPEDPPGNDQVNQTEFCQRLNALETHMNDGLEHSFGTDFTSSHECDCSELYDENKSFAIECSMWSIDQDDTFFEYLELMLFRLHQGEYKLSETSWSYFWEVNSTHFESLEYQEVLTFDKGVLASCEVENCASCTVCDDNQSIAIDCLESNGYERNCSEYYTGTIAHLFGFGMISEN